MADQAPPPPSSPPQGLAHTTSRGDWGEGRSEHVDVQRARADFDELCRATSRERAAAASSSQRRGETAGASAASGLRRVISRGGPKSQTEGSAQQPADVEAQQQSQEKPSGANDDDEEEHGFDLGRFILARQQQNEKEGKASGQKPLGVAWKDLTVLAPPGSGGGSLVKTLPVAIANTAFRDPLTILSFLIPGFGKLLTSKKNGAAAPQPLIQGQLGILRPSEMLLVLGRPGSGCSTTLRAITSNLHDNVSLRGSLTYGGFEKEEVERKLRGEVIFVDEEDTHFPTLTVAQTLRFALRNKVPNKKARPGGESRGDFIETIIDVLLKMVSRANPAFLPHTPFADIEPLSQFAMSHVRDTIVGDSAQRGVSGGERKRVTISESLATSASVSAHDNATRGLDASTALEYARSLRIITDLSKRTTIATLYQVSESIYDLFDRVAVIDEGRCIYFGPRDQARQYFVDLGYLAPPRQTTADFVTAVTDPNQMQFREGCERSTPRSAEERERAWKESALHAKLVEEYEQYIRDVESSDASEGKAVKSTVRHAKNKGVRKGSVYTVPFQKQIQATIVRQAQIKWAARNEFRTQVITVVGVSLLISSVFYNQPFDSSGTFTRGGILLFSALFVGWLQLSEAFEAVSGRPILFRHKQFAFARPSAQVLARALIDIPQLLILTTLASVIIYFMAHLRIAAGAFWIYFVLVFLSAYNFTSLYRLFAALSPGFNEAIRFSVLALNVTIIFSGYVLPRKNMNWTIWLSWVNGVSYAFEGFMANEFRYPIQCAAAQIIPFGEARDVAYQTCALQGATPGSLTVDPEAFLQTSFGYSQAHIGRAIGAVIGFTALYLIPTIFLSEVFSFQGGGGVTVFARTKRAKQLLKQSKGPAADDVEAGASKLTPSTSDNDSADRTRAPTPNEEKAPKLKDGAELTAAQTRKYDSKPVFTWRDVNLVLPNGRKLLQNVDGMVRPGQMTALMGASGAGKTTLMSSLSQRDVAGTLTGDILVDGKPLGPGFQKSTGFVLQGDIHVPTQTVREAVEFAALLRQPAEVPREQKLKDAQNALELLELVDLQDALIGVPGAGLNVERRKRVTIAVELASKPDLLLFLDEPTSGLDSAGAASICRLLRRLAEDGQAILCTIHQPSVEIFEAFDEVVLLQEGGRLTYAGPIGDDTVTASSRNSKTIRDYFESNGAERCPPDANVAEYILETVSGRGGEGTKWNERWLTSETCKERRKHIDDLNAERRERPLVEDSRARAEFSADAWTQFSEVVKRQFRDVWRDSSFGYGVLFSNFVTAFIAGGAFYNIGFSTRDLQNRTFVVLLILLNCECCHHPKILRSLLTRLLMSSPRRHQCAHRQVLPAAIHLGDSRGPVEDVRVVGLHRRVHHHGRPACRRELDHLLPSGLLLALRHAVNRHSRLLLPDDFDAQHLRDSLRAAARLLLANASYLGQLAAVHSSNSLRGGGCHYPAAAAQGALVGRSVDQPDLVLRSWSAAKYHRRRARRLW